MAKANYLIKQKYEYGAFVQKNAGLVRNLLTEYNALQAQGEEITAAQAMRDAGFLRYAAMEIKNTIVEEG